MKTSVSIRKIETYDLAAVKAAVSDFLAQDSPARLANARTVLIKPNLVGPFAPEQAVTTHPIVLEAVITCLLDKGKEVWMGDSPGGTANLKQVWNTCGLTDLANRYPIKLVNFASFGVQEMQADDITLQVSKVIWEADAVLSVSKYKTHSLMAYSGAVKNLYGLIPGLVKSTYHRQYPETGGFAHLLAMLHKSVKHRIAYHIMDGIVGMDGAGPSAGNPRNFGLLFGSASAAALDYIGSSLMGFKLQQVPYLTEILHDDGILPSAIEIPISFQGFKLPQVDRNTVGFRSQAIRYVPGFVKYGFRKLFDFYPVIMPECKACLICVQSCPMQTIRVMPDKKPHIMVDNCIRCMCCHEMCPHHAITVHKTWLANLLFSRNP